MALTYIGPADKFYAKVTVSKNFQRTLTPIPGETYQIDDPGDGNWVAEADKGPVTPDTTKSDENGSTEAVEEES